jgi:AbrB family looped-hinge helix DNA binding protein
MSDVRRATIRQRRQITLPADFCEKLKLETGDSLDLEVKEGAVVLTPNRQRALDALSAIQEAFQKSGITEEELQKTARRIRHKLVRERYGEPRKA